jgi:hypothetical protein
MYFFTAALGLICSMQEKSKKILLGVLEKAVDICDSRGVWPLDHFLSGYI